MIYVQISENTPQAFEKAMRIFKKKTQKDGFIREIRERRYYKKPSIKKREKRIQAKRKKK